jgi:mono/diheme cytochrome c family protein
MDAGKILSLTQGAIDAGLASTLAGWGANKFDVRNPTTVNTALDDGADNPTITPPIWNFVDLEASGYAFGWDGLFFGTDALASQAEAVYHLVMGGKGAFGTAAGAIPPALRVTPPDRILNKLAGAASASPTITAEKLRDVQEWMRSITSPAPGAFDAAKAEQGWRVFNTRGCTGCHSTPELSGSNLVYPIPGSTGDLAGGIRPPSLRGLTAAGPPYFHDGRAATLAAAVALMANQVGGLTAAEQAAVVEYLKSL